MQALVDDSNDNSHHFPLVSNTVYEFLLMDGAANYILSTL
jgi:hypothetical protein